MQVIPTATLVNPGKSIKVRLTTAHTNEEVELGNALNRKTSLELCHIIIHKSNTSEVNSPK